MKTTFLYGLLVWLLTGGAFSAAQVGAEEDTLDGELAAARARLDEAARELAELQRRRAPQLATRVPLPVSLGLILGRPGDEGLEVMGVTPGSVAADHGIAAGDVLTAVDGRSLAGGNLQTLRDLFRSQRDPGDYVAVDYTRDGQPLAAQLLVPEAPTSLQLLGDVPQGDSGVAMATSAVAFAGVPRSIAGAASLYDLTPGLGRYFGVRAGVLVLRAGDDPDRLMAGDVITAVEGVPVSHQPELFAALTGPKAVTVIRDGGVQVLTLDRDQLAGGTMGFISVDRGHRQVDVLVNPESVSR